MEIIIDINNNNNNNKIKKMSVCDTDEKGKRKVRSDLGKAQGGNTDAKKEVNAELKSIAEHLVAGMISENQHYDRNTIAFRNQFGLDSSVFENSLNHSKSISEKKVKDQVEKQDGIMKDIETYYSGLKIDNVSDKKFKDELKPILERESASFSVDALNEMVEMENRFRKQSEIKTAYYQWCLGEKSKEAKAWEIIESECDSREKEQHKKKKPTSFLSQNMD